MITTLGLAALYFTSFTMSYYCVRSITSCYVNNQQTREEVITERKIHEE